MKPLSVHLSRLGPCVCVWQRQKIQHTLAQRELRGAGRIDLALGPAQTLWALSPQLPDEDELASLSASLSRVAPKMVPSAPVVDSFSINLAASGEKLPFPRVPGTISGRVFIGPAQVTCP